MPDPPSRENLANLVRIKIAKFGHFGITFTGPRFPCFFLSRFFPVSRGFSGVETRGN